MSYLNATRLHFSGRFQADPSTVNNDVKHFDNATFRPEDQLPQTPGHLNGWWNPRGTGAWRLIDCTVTQAHYADGSMTADPAKDPVVGMAVAGSDQRVAGTIVDLDPEQQLVSEIWGLTVRLTGDAGDLFTSAFKVAPFTDIWWQRGSGMASGDSAASAIYQSLLQDVAWGDISASRLLRELRELVGDGPLSIKFNVDSYNMDSSSPEFTIGRIVGTIGPALPGEPAHFVTGRQFMPQMVNGAPANGMFFATAVVDERRGKVIADFGNAIPTTGGSPLKSLGPLMLAVSGPKGPVPLGAFPKYDHVDWYENTAGVIEFPSDRSLSRQELALIADNPLLVLGRQGGQWAPFVTESVGGLYVRADQFVRRMNPGDSTTVELYATHYGRPLPGAEILFYFDNRGIEQQVGSGDPAVGVPTEALTYQASRKTDSAGKTKLTLKAGDPGNPRGYIDGQLYGIGYNLAAVQQMPLGVYNPDPSNFISVLVWNETPVPETVTWADVQPILQQYGNLYPLMDGLVRLGNYDDVAAHAAILHFAFGLDPANPNYMPVTRDLSRNKRAMILNWPSTPGRDGKPVKGRAPRARMGAPPPAPGPELQAAVALDGKTAARQRRAASLADAGRDDERR